MKDREQLPGLFYYRPSPRLKSPPVIVADLCVYGATAAGAVAAIAMRRLGHSCILLSFDTHVGGMTSGGLGATDIGNKAAIGGIAREFYRRLGSYYETDEAWAFEPHVAERVLLEMLAEAGVSVHFNRHLEKVHKETNHIQAIEMTDGSVCRAKVFIDASYEGDLMARAGVSYHVGRESNSVYHETPWAGGWSTKAMSKFPQNRRIRLPIGPSPLSLGNATICWCRSACRPATLPMGPFAWSRCSWCWASRRRRLRHWRSRGGVRYRMFPMRLWSQCSLRPSRYFFGRVPVANVTDMWDTNFGWVYLDWDGEASASGLWIMLDKAK